MGPASGFKISLVGVRCCLNPIILISPTMSLNNGYIFLLVSQITKRKRRKKKKKKLWSKETAPLAQCDTPCYVQTSSVRAEPRADDSDT